MREDKITDYAPRPDDIAAKGDETAAPLLYKNRKQKMKRTRSTRRKSTLRIKKKKIFIAMSRYDPYHGYVKQRYDSETEKCIGKYVKHPRHSKLQNNLKKLTNKRLRRIRPGENDLGRKGNAYRKESGVDYWWELY